MHLHTPIQRWQWPWGFVCGEQTLRLRSCTRTHAGLRSGLHAPSLSYLDFRRQEETLRFSCTSALASGSDPGLASLLLSPDCAYAKPTRTPGFPSLSCLSFHTRSPPWFQFSSESAPGPALAGSLHSTLGLQLSQPSPRHRARPLRIMAPKAGHASPVLPSLGRVATVCLASLPVFSVFTLSDSPRPIDLTSFDKSPPVHTFVIPTPALSRITVFFGSYANPMTYFLPNSVWWLLLEIVPNARVTVFSKQNYRMSSQAEQWVFSGFVV